jgi:3',5'-cyclic AMP phosphodiesterase CpdA
VKYERARGMINAIDADLVIHSGDITNSNQFSEYKKAFVKIKELEHPRLIVPGNNDLQTIGWELFPKMMGPLDPYLETDKFRVMGINSVDPALENGNIGRKKVAEVISTFKEKSNDKVNIVTFYHNLIPHPKTKFESMLSDSGNVLKFFTDPDNNIHFVLTGHDHISFSLQLEDTVLSSCGTLSSKEILDTKGNSFDVINCYKDGFVEIEKIFVDSGEKEINGQYWINLNWGNKKSN